MKTKQEILNKNSINFDNLKEDMPLLAYNIEKSMKQYADQFKPDWNELRKKFFKECTIQIGMNSASVRHEFYRYPVDLFEWFKKNI